MAAFEDTLTATSTAYAPWYVIPADHKWIARAVVSAIVVHAIDSLDLRIRRWTSSGSRDWRLPGSNCWLSKTHQVAITAW